MSCMRSALGQRAPWCFSRRKCRALFCQWTRVVSGHRMPLRLRVTIRSAGHFKAGCSRPSFHSRSSAPRRKLPVSSNVRRPVDPIGFILGLGLVALLYLTAPIAALALLALLIARRRTRRFGTFVGLARADVWNRALPLAQLGLRTRISRDVVFVLLLYFGQVVILCLFAGLLWLLCVWVWKRLNPSSRPNAAA